MSWNVVAFVAPEGAVRLADIPEDYRRPVIGRRDEIIETVTRVAGWSDATDPSWINLQGGHHMMDVELGQDLEVHTITFHVRGGGGCELLMRAVAEELNLVLVNPTTRELMPVDPDTDALEEWEAYCDRMR